MLKAVKCKKISNYVYVNLPTLKYNYALISNGGKQIHVKLKGYGLLQKDEIYLTDNYFDYLNIKVGDLVQIKYYNSIKEFAYYIDSEVILFVLTCKIIQGNSNPSLHFLDNFNTYIKDIPLNNDFIYYYMYDNEIDKVRYSFKLQSSIQMTYSANNFKINIDKLEDSTEEKIFKDVNFNDFNIGGLDEQIKTILRVVFSTRVMSKEANEMGIKPPRGILLCGKPGCGKTLIARQLSKAINSTTFKIINGPELKNKYVGQSEANAREIFKDAEKDPTGFHVIVFDEADSILGRRSFESDRTDVNNGIINTLLSKIDGVNQLDNILIIAMTNHKHAIDEALLRPGRIELHIDIPLPNKEGRKKILEIHAKKALDNGYISEDVDFEILSEMTNNFTGAELESIIKKAATYPLIKQIDPKTMKRNNDKKPIITMNDFINAVHEIIPMFGAFYEDIKPIISAPLLLNDEKFANIYQQILNLINDNNQKCRNYTILIYGKPFVGKTKMIAHIIENVTKNFSQIDMITPEKFYNNNINIWKSFQDGKTAKEFLFVIDGIEKIYNYNTSSCLPKDTKQLLTLLNVNVALENKIVTILTCSDYNMIETLNLKNNVNDFFEI